MAFPTSQAAVFIRDAPRTDRRDSRALDLPLTDVVKGRVPVDMMVPGTALAGRRADLGSGGASARQPVFDQFSFFLRPTGGVKVDVEPYHYGCRNHARGPAVVPGIDHVHPRLLQQHVEPPIWKGPAGRTSSRLEAAKIALKQMLSGLADEGDARVGVIFYVTGRLESEKTGRNFAGNPIMPGRFPDDLRPSEDVELVLPLGRFDQVRGRRPCST